MSKVRIINFSTYTTPEVIEKKNQEWVEYGDSNDYYQYLIDMYYGSPTNNRCVKGIADLIYGQGLEAKRSNRNLDAYVEMRKLFSDDCLRNVAMDLKMLGQGAFQIVKSKDKKTIAKAYHFPIHTLRPEKCNDKGEIEAYYYCADWSKLKKGDKPKRIPNFDINPEAAESILVIHPYSTGSYYFSPVDYQGGLQYAELETEISNYHINNIKNGLAPSMLINFNNGEPPEETKNLIESAIMDKWSGTSNAGKAIISWNDSGDTKADVTPVPLSDAHNQYEFLSRESQDKVLVAHGITSPLIFGIKSGGDGFSSNAEELRTSIVLFDNMVIRPFQNLMIQAINQILEYQDFSLDLYFKSLNPLYDENEKVDESEATMFSFSSDDSEEEELAKTYNDYPKGATSNAKRALEWVEKHGWGDCGESTGKNRAHQLANREPISRDTISRMASFKRHQQHKDVPYSEGCGGLMWDAWGGDAGINWAQRKLEEIDNEELMLKEPCWDGYEQIGWKEKNGQRVPNCVPIKTSEVSRLESHKMDMTDNDAHEWLVHLQDKGEIIDDAEWELVNVHIVDNEEEEENIDEQKLFKEYADVEEKSKDDKGIFKIRYRYGPSSFSSKSREFCKDMVSSRKNGVVYRREDIQNMGRAGVNGSFAPQGKSTYSIWKFKGGVYCHHYWERLTFRRRFEKGKGSKVLPLQPNEKNTTKRDIDKNYVDVPNSEANAEGVPFSPPSWRKANTKPIDMPNRGSLKNK